VNWEKLIQNVGITYVQHIKVELATRTRMVIPVPKYPTTALAKYNLAEEVRIKRLNTTIEEYDKVLDFNNRKSIRPGLTEDELDVLSSKKLDILDKLNTLTTKLDS
jgi:hypothetical protein